MNGRQRRSPLAIVAAIAVMLALATGCTQRESHDQYQETIAAAVDVRHDAFAAAHDGGSARDLRDQAAATATQRSRLQQIHPPSDVQQAHDRYVEGLEQLHDVLNRLASCADMQEDDPSGATSCRAQISQQTLDEIDNDFSEADAIFTHAGYTVGGVANSNTKGA